MHDIIIIGGGPAGLTAGLYAANQKISVLVVTRDAPLREDFSGQPARGMDFVVEKFRQTMKGPEQLLAIREGSEVMHADKNVVSFSVETAEGQILYAQALIIASGKNAEGEGNSGFEHAAAKDHGGRFRVDAEMRTNIAGIFAAGDVNSVLVKDEFLASAEGARAALSAVAFLKTLKN